VGVPDLPPGWSGKRGHAVTLLVPVACYLMLQATRRLVLGSVVDG